MHFLFLPVSDIDAYDRARCQNCKFQCEQNILQSVITRAQYFRLLIQCLPQTAAGFSSIASKCPRGTMSSIVAPTSARSSSSGVVSEIRNRITGAAITMLKAVRPHFGQSHKCQTKEIKNGYQNGHGNKWGGAKERLGFRWSLPS